MIVQSASLLRLWESMAKL